MAGEIKLTATGKCNGCPFMDLAPVTLYGGAEKAVMFYRCERSNLCDRLEAYLRRKMDEEADGT